MVPLGVVKRTWSPVTKWCGPPVLMMSLTRSTESADETNAAPICSVVALPAGTATGTITPYWRPLSSPSTSPCPRAS